MKLLGIGVIIFMLGIAFVGVYFCLYGGIVQLIHGLQAPLSASNIAFGVVRILLTLPCLWLEIIIGGAWLVTELER